MFKKPTLHFFCFLLFCGCSKTDKDTQKSNVEKRHALNLTITANDIAPNRKIEILDSVLVASPNSPKDTLALWSIMKKSNLLYTLDEKDSAFYYDKLLFKKASKTDHTIFCAISSNNIGYNLYRNQKFDSAYYYYNVSKNNYLRLGDSAKVGRRLLSMANIQKDYNDLFGAKETVTKAIEYLSNTTNYEQLTRANDLLGTINRLLLNFEDAITYHQNAIALQTNTIAKSGFRNNLALVYKDLGEYPKAIAVYEKILNDSILNINSSRYARVFHNLTYCKWKNGTSEVEKDFLHALELRKKTNDLRGLVSSYTNLGEFYTEHDQKTAKMYLDNLISVSKRVKMPQGEVDALGILMELEPKNLTVKDRYIHLKDSLYQQELKVKTQFAKMRYDDEQEKARLLALEAETAEKETQLAKEETQRILLLSAMAILLMGSISLYFMLKQRHKKEKLKEIYNTEKRISQDLHDGLANDVFGLMTSIQNQKTDHGALLNKLDTIYEVTRKISHENSSIQTGEDFLGELSNLIGTYQNNGVTILTKGLKDIDWKVFNEQKCIALHRSIKELLVNMKKHSQASFVSLQFYIKKKSLVIKYRDNGIGMKTNKAMGIGLQHIGSRINYVNGAFKLNQKVDKGIEIELTIPV